MFYLLVLLLLAVSALIWSPVTPIVVSIIGGYVLGGLCLMFSDNT